MDNHAQEYSKFWMTVLLDYRAWMQCSIAQLSCNAVPCCRKSDHFQIRLSSITSVASCLMECDRLCLVNTWTEDAWRRFVYGRKESYWLNRSNAFYFKPRLWGSTKRIEGCWWSCHFHTMYCWDPGQTLSLWSNFFTFTSFRCCEVFIMHCPVVPWLHFNDQWNVF